ncbi:hypothetical protein S100390_v1c05950 [Spiroplasma sp. NBRC 100390]|nr:hypothetical protein [Spiroplasma sp. TU-14]AOX43932.1 hypothetical protein STU14_v1c05950 [Spiroplasma sp. TU-14]APE13402.1 hypothetical protein S100390_v1c05950 [Spiroplasma sp. NBRC 100390]
MAKKKLNETKQLQEVNNSLKMKVNETTVIKALTKAWKKSEPYLKLMTEYETLNATSTVDWDNRYEKEYEKFIKAVLGENVNFKKTTTKKASRPIEKIKTTASKKSNMGLNPGQLDLLAKRKLYRSEDLFPARVVRGYQESQEAIESELKEPRESFLNNNINALAVDQKEKEVGLISTVNLTFETEDDNLAVENITGKSTPKEVEDLIRKLNPNQQRLIRQRNEQYGRYHSEREKNISEHHDEYTGEILKTFNNQVKEHAKSWGLNQNQIELLARRDATNHDEHPYLNRARGVYHPEEDYSRVNSDVKPRSLDEIKEQMNLSKNQLELLSRRDSHPSEWKQYMKEITLSKDDNEEKVVIDPENVIKKRNQMVQESLSRSLGKTKKQIGGKYIRNFITDEPQRKPIFKTDLYLDTAITNQIRPLFVKAIQKPKPTVLSKFVTTNVMSNPANTSFSAPSSNNLTQLNGAAKESTPNKTTVLPAMSPQEKYISTVDPKKRPNLKKLKFGNNYEEKRMKKLDVITMTKEQLSLDNMKIKKDANEKARLIDLTLYTQKELKDYQINYLDPTKTPDLTINLAGNQYTFAGYHPREIREIERQQLEQLHERLVKEKLIQKNIRKEVRYQKKLRHRKIKPKPLPQILINKYLAEGKKVVNGFLVDSVEDKTGEEHQKK